MTYASPFILSNWKPGYKLDCGNKQTQSGNWSLVYNEDLNLGSLIPQQ